MADGALPSTYTAPPNIGTAGSASGSSMTQGAALPAITTTQSQATAAPSWYTDYLQGIANQGNAAGANAQFIGPTAMQNQSYDLAQSNVGNWKPAMDTATGAISQSTGVNPLAAAQPYLNSGVNPTYNTVDKYMSPYINDVVSQIGNLAQTNLMQNVAPQTTAGVVGSGQFGSKRGAEVLGQTLANYGQGVTAAQTGALNTGYQNAMTYAGADANRELQAGQTAGSLEAARQSNLINAGQVGGVLAMDTQNLGIGDVNTLNTLGTQQQQIEQARQLFPMQVAQQKAGLLQGAQIPTSVSSTYTGPIPGAYQSSPLAQIAGIGSILGGISNTPLGTAIGSGLSSLVNGSSGGSGLQPGYTPTDGQSISTGQIQYDSSGNPTGTYDANGAWNSFGGMNNVDPYSTDNLP